MKRNEINSTCWKIKKDRKRASEKAKVIATILEDRLARRSQRAQLQKIIQIVNNFTDKKSTVLFSAELLTIKDVGLKNCQSSVRLSL